MEYALTQRRQQFRVAAENPRKVSVKNLLEEAGHRILIIGEFLSQLEELSEVTNLPQLQVKPQLKRNSCIKHFGMVSWGFGYLWATSPSICLMHVLIQVSGKYGSRQEEAQRLGRILRPKSDGRSARFYTLVSLRTCEEEFARHRQLFLTEQGYGYQIEIID